MGEHVFYNCFSQLSPIPRALFPATAGGPLDFPPPRATRLPATAAEQELSIHGTFGEAYVQWHIWGGRCGGSNHHQKRLSIMDIQKDLVEEYFKENPSTIQQDEKVLKENIFTYIRNLNTKERKMRMEILRGEFVHYDYNGVMYR